MSRTETSPFVVAEFLKGRISEFAESEFAELENVAAT
jgi:hypothetical protein